MGDLIERDWVLKRMLFAPDADTVRMAPAVEVEPVRYGRWIYGITLNHEWKKCSECLVSQDMFGCFTYCPNCGAKMNGEGDAE